MQPKESVQETLLSFENDHNINIFDSRDFGSRAMGLDGPNSDRDIMFIFSQPPDEYINCGGYTDTIVQKRSGYDFQGWNLKKFIDLYCDSNPQTLEYLRSLRTYYTSGYADVGAAMDTLRHHAYDNFNPIGLYYHYRSMAKNNYSTYLSETVYDDHGHHEMVEEELAERWVLRDGRTVSKADWERGSRETSIKRNLFAIRATLYARHVRETHTLPEMDFKDFIRNSDIPLPNENTLWDLVDAKTGDEDSYREIGNVFGDYIEDEIDREPTSDDFPSQSIDKEVTRDLVSAVLDEYYPVRKS